MTVARDAALRLLQHYRLHSPLTESELVNLCAHLGVQVRSLPRHSSVREVRVGRYIALRDGESRGWRIWLLAHALGHYLLHRGDQFSIDSWWIAHQERQAEEFAGWLLFASVSPDWETWRVAEECDVPYECVRRWEWLVTSGGSKPLGC